jgi:hypothetical protein
VTAALDAIGQDHVVDHHVHQPLLLLHLVLTCEHGYDWAIIIIIIVNNNIQRACTWRCSSKILALATSCSRTVLTGVAEQLTVRGRTP